MIGYMAKHPASAGDAKIYTRLVPNFSNKMAEEVHLNDGVRRAHECLISRLCGKDPTAVLPEESMENTPVAKGRRSTYLGMSGIRGLSVSLKWASEEGPKSRVG